MIVLPDADIDMAADAPCPAAYGSAGERCMAISVVVAVGDVADPLVEAISSGCRGSRSGPGSDPEAEMGPLITREHRDKVASTSRAARPGRELVVDGRASAVPGWTGLLPGRLAARQGDARDGLLPQRDLRPGAGGGPGADLRRGGRLINDNPYANGTAIFTRDGGAARQFQFEVDVGMVGINVPIPVPVAYYSFGGWKASLFGDLHMYGPEGVQFYTRAKVVTARWPDPGPARSTWASPHAIASGGERPGRTPLRDAHRPRRLRARSDHRRGGAGHPAGGHLPAGRGRGAAERVRLRAQRQPDPRGAGAGGGRARGWTHGVAYASGLAATQNLLYLLEPGQRILLGDDVYGGTWRLAEKVWSRYGVQVDVADLRDLDAVASALTAQTGMIWLESPTNPLLKVVDIRAMARLAATAGR